MMNLAKTSKNQAPLTLDRHERDKIRYFKSKIETGKNGLLLMRRSEMPSSEERASLRERAVLLRDALSINASSDQITAIIAVLFSAMPSQQRGEASAKALFKSFDIALASFPFWCVDAVSRRFIDGSLGKGTFAPTPAEMARACNEHIAPFHAELNSIKMILKAKEAEEPPPFERRKELAEKVIKEFSQSVVEGLEK